MKLLKKKHKIANHQLNTDKSNNYAKDLTGKSNSGSISSIIPILSIIDENAPNAKDAANVNKGG